MINDGKIKGHYILIAFIVAMLCVVMLLNAYRSFAETKEGQRLEAIISDLTFESENSEAEIKLLTDFEHEILNLSHRDTAIYYGTLTKLYMLCGDSDSALKTFVDTQINGEISVAYDVIAWLYADIAQIYINFYTYDVAKECIVTALEYAKGQDVGEFFYEYCYMILAELYAQTGNTAMALQYCKASIDADALDLPEYQSMELRRHIVNARVALKENDIAKCNENLEPVTQAVAHLEYLPMDVLWISEIYYPMLEINAILSLDSKNYQQAFESLNGMFAAGTLYGQLGRVMSFMPQVIDTLENIESETSNPVIIATVENYTRKLILEYPKLFTERNSTAGEHIFNSNMITIAVFVQKYKLENFYTFVARIAVVVSLLIALLILVWRKSERKGRVDGLSGAYNRKYFDINYELLNRGKVPFGIIMYDIDFFKQINDGFGHDAGDTVIRDVAKKAMSCLDKDAKLYRYGGDEFCIICKRKTLEEMLGVAEKIRSSVESMRWKNWEGLKTSLSLGVGGSAYTDKEVMAVVDENLYKSKAAGRNCVNW